MKFYFLVLSVFLFYTTLATKVFEKFPFEVSLSPLLEQKLSSNQLDTQFILNPDTVVIDNANIQGSSIFVPYFPDDLIKDRLQCIQSHIPLHYNAKVRSFIDYFTIRDRAYLLDVLQRINIYFPLFEKKLKAYGLPDEIKYLSIVESGLRLDALSVKRALGLWQFIPSTARLNGLQVTYAIDERMDPEKATEAACRYLKYLYSLFNDWELAMAAYNCGPGNVKKAIRRSGKTKFWDIYKYLPRETRSYLPQYVAITYSVKYAQEHNLIPDRIEYATPSKAIWVNQSADLKKFAKLLNVCVQDLQTLNPQLKLKYLPAGFQNYKLQIPSKRFDYFLKNRQMILEKVKVDKNTKYTHNTNYHIVRRGETLGNIAQRYRVSVNELRTWNNLIGSKIFPRQRLYLHSKKTTYNKPINRTKTKTKPKVSVSKTKPYVDKKGQKIHITRYGENLWTIAKKYRISVSEIKYKNGLIGDYLSIGQKLIIP